MARGRFNFYLNFLKDDELMVAERIDDLKRRRSFTSVIREGIIIISELREGRCDTLLANYPWIVDAIKAPAPPTDNGDLKREIADLKRIVLEQGRAIPDTRESGFPAFAPVMKPSKLQKVIALPIIEPDIDDQDTIVVSERKDDMTTTKNFLASFGMVMDMDLSGVTAASDA